MKLNVLLSCCAALALFATGCDKTEPKPTGGMGGAPPAVDITPDDTAPASETAPADTTPVEVK